jgi:hypothetical protein
MKQRLLTIGLGRILQTFIEQQTAGCRIVAISPHYSETAMLMGYLVVVEDPAREEGGGDGRL